MKPAPESQTLSRRCDYITATTHHLCVRNTAGVPLQNLSGAPAQEYFSDGRTGALITDLAQIRSLSF